MLCNAEGRFAIAFFTASNIDVPADCTALTMLVMPFLSIVIMLLPRLIQLNAVNTLTTACIIWGILAINVGIACISPSPSVTIICSPSANNLGALSLINPAIFVTICGTYSISVGRLLAMPWARFSSKLMPASTNVPKLARRFWANDSTMGSACAKKLGTPCASPAPRLCSICAPTGITWSTSADRILPIAGSRLPAKKVVTVCARPCNAGPTSRPSVKLAITLLAAACMDANEPDSVVAASSAVVPVMPRLSWITWMASMMELNGTSLTVSAVTLTLSPSTPLSLISRAISAWVPP